MDSVLISPFYVEATTNEIEGLQGLVSSINVTNLDSSDPNLFLQKEFSAGSIVILYNVSSVSTSYYSILANSAINATAGPTTQSINPNACTILTASMIDSSGKNIQWTTLCSNRSIGDPQGASPANTFLPLISQNTTILNKTTNQTIYNFSSSTPNEQDISYLINIIPGQNRGILCTYINVIDSYAQFTGYENYVNGSQIKYMVYAKSSATFLNIYKESGQYGASHWVSLNESFHVDIIETYNYDETNLYNSFSSLIADVFVSYDPTINNKLPENSFLRLVSLSSVFNTEGNGCPYLNGVNQPGSMTVFYNNQTASTLYVANLGYIDNSQATTFSVSPSCCLIVICVFYDGTKYHWVSLANNTPF